jgi:MFS family permease
MTSTLPTPGTTVPCTVTWTAVLRLPHCGRLLTATLIGRLPHGMAPVAVLLAARADGLGYTAGAALAALYGVGYAIGQPLLGRVADRIGQTRPLVASALISTVLLLTLASTGTTAVIPAAALTTAAGLTSPPLEAGLRALWPDVVPTPAHLRAAYGLDSGSQEVVYICGPLLATATAMLADPHTALALTALIGLLGTLAVAHAQPSRTWQPAGHRAPGAPGALRPVAIRLLLLSMTSVGAAIGALYVAAVAAAETHHAAWLGGALPAAMSLGAITGTALFTRRPWHTPLYVQLAFLAAAFVLAWIPLQLGAGPAVLVGCALLPGLAFGPLLTTAYHCVDAYGAPGTVTESFGWLVSAFGAGTGGGTIIAGTAQGSLTVPAAAALCALVFAFLLRFSVTRPTPSAGTR